MREEDHHDCAALKCPIPMRGYHHYWYMHVHVVAGCGICENLAADMADQRRRMVAEAFGA